MVRSAKILFFLCLSGTFAYLAWYIFTHYSFTGKDWPVVLVFGICAWLAVSTFFQALGKMGSMLKKWQETKRTSKIYGDAKWMGLFGAWKRGLLKGYRNSIFIGTLKNCPLWLGKKFKAPVLVIAPTQSGKTSSFVMNTLLTNTEDSVILTDIKPELYEQTAKYREEQGHIIVKIDPYGEYTDLYNPLINVIRAAQAGRSDLVEEYAAAAALALIPEPKNDGRNSVFRQIGRDILIAVISYLAVHEPENCTLPTIWSILHSQDDLFKQILKEMAFSEALNGTLQSRADNLSQEIKRSSEAFKDGYTNAVKAISRFSPASAFARVVSGSSFSGRDAREALHTIYITCPIQHKESGGLLMGLIVNSLFTELKANPKGKRVIGLLDEFTNMPGMEGIASDITVVSGLKIRLFLIIQNTKQLEDAFNRAISDIIQSSCEVTIAFKLDDLQHARDLSAFIGTQTVKTKSVNQNSKDGQFSPSYSEIGRPLVTPEQLLRLKKDEQLVLIRGERPILCKMLQFWNILPHRHNAGAHPTLDEPLPRLRLFRAQRFIFGKRRIRTLHMPYASFLFVCKTVKILWPFAILSGIAAVLYTYLPELRAFL